MRGTSLRLAAGVAAALAASAVAGPGAGAQSVEEFYRGKTITMLVGSDVGGGYDTYARLVARHLGRQIPGNPGIVAQNMPSVASVAATNHMINVAPRDGTVIGAIQREIAMVQLAGTHGTKFKASDLLWLGSLLSEPGVCGFSSRSGVTAFEDVFRREVIMGSSGPNALEHYPSMFNNMLGAKFKIVKGYRSASDVGLAIERGEVNGMCQSWTTFKQLHANALANGTIKPMVQVALKPHPEMVALGLPNYTKFVTPERIQKGYTRDDVVDFFNFQLASSLMGRPYAISSAVPADRSAALIAAFNALVKDAEFIGDAAKSKREIEFVSGREITDIIKQMEKLPKDKLDRVDDVLKN